MTRPADLRLLLGIALCSTIVDWADTGRATLALVVGGLLAAGLVLPLLTPFMGGLPACKQAELHPDPAARIPQAFATAVNPNIMAGALALLLPLALALPAYAWPQLAGLSAHWP